MMTAPGSVASEETMKTFRKLVGLLRACCAALLVPFGGLANSEAGYIEFGIGGMFANPNAGNTVATGSGGGPVQFGIIQNVELDISQALKELMGQNKFPDDVAPSDMKVTGKGGFARLNIPIMNNLFYADTVATGGSIVQPNEAHTVPGSPYTVDISPPNSGTFGQDLGVVYAANFAPLKLDYSLAAIGSYAIYPPKGVLTAVVGSTAGTGYKVGDLITLASGVGGSGTGLILEVATIGALGAIATLSIVNPGSGYTAATNGATTDITGVGANGTVTTTVNGTSAEYIFNALDTTAAVLISYRYTVTTGNTLTVTNHVQGYGPVFELFLLEHYNGLNGLHLYACRASKLSHPLKRADYMIPEFDFTGYANPAGNVMDFYDDGTGLGG
jgi:hypothetical protein